MIYAYNGDSDSVEDRATLLLQGRTVIHTLARQDYVSGPFTSVEAFAKTILADFSRLSEQLGTRGVFTVEPTRECLPDLAVTAAYCFGSGTHVLEAHCTLIESEMVRLPEDTRPPVELYCAQVEIYYDNIEGEKWRYDAKYPIWKLGTRMVEH